MEDVENYMKQFNWIKDYEDKWSVAYSNTGKTKGINYTFFQEKLEMVFYTFNYSEENLVKSIQEIKDKYGVTLEETVSFEDNVVMYKFEGEAIVNNEKCIINISTNKKRIIMISYYVIKGNYFISRLNHSSKSGSAIKRPFSVCSIISRSIRAVLSLTRLERLPRSYWPVTSFFPKSS